MTVINETAFIFMAKIQKRNKNEPDYRIHYPIMNVGVFLRRKNEKKYNRYFLNPQSKVF